MSAADEIHDMRNAGFSDEEIDEWKSQQSQGMLGAGFSQKDVAEHWNGGPVNDRAAKDATVLSSTGEPVATGENINPLEAFGRGLKGGIGGMVVTDEVGKGISPEEGIVDQVAYGVGEFISDLPVSVPAFITGAVPGGWLGATGGGALGALGGPAAPVTVPAGVLIGGVVGAGVTGGAIEGQVTGMTREGLIQFYRDNPDAELGPIEFMKGMYNALRNWDAAALSDETAFLDKMFGEEALAQGAFERNIGAVTGVVGPAGKGLAKPIVKGISNSVAKKAITSTLETTAEAVAITAMVAQAQDGMPTAKDFAVVASTLLTFKVGMGTANHARNALGAEQRAADASIDRALERTIFKEDIDIVTNNLQDIFVATGMEPDQVRKMAESDPGMYQSLFIKEDKVSFGQDKVEGEVPDVQSRDGAPIEESLTFHAEDHTVDKFVHVKQLEGAHNKLVESASPEVSYTPADAVADNASHARLRKRAEPNEGEFAAIQKFTEFDVKNVTPKEHRLVGELVRNSSLEKETTVYRGTAFGKGKGTGVRGQEILSTSFDVKTAMDFARINSDAKAGDLRAMQVQKIILEPGADALDVTKLGTREVEGEVLISVEGHDNATVVGTETVKSGDITYEVETIRISAPERKLTLAESHAIMREESGQQPPELPQTQTEGGGGGGEKPPGTDVGPVEFGKGGTKELRNLADDQLAIASQVVRQGRRRGYSVNEFRYEYVNDLQFAVTEPRDAYAKQGGRKLSVEENPGELMRLAGGSHAKTELDISHGIFNDDGVKIGKSLEEILKALPDEDVKSIRVKFGDGEDAIVNPFRDYLIAKRVVEKANQGFDLGENVAAARNVAQAGNKNPAWVKASNEIGHWNDSGVKELVTSGLMSKDRAERMIELNKDYIPFSRVMFEGDAPAGVSSRGVPVSNPVKHFKGSERKMRDPIETLVKNRYFLQQLADNNVARRGMVDFNRSLPKEDQFITRVGDDRVKPSERDKVTDLPIDEEIPSTALRPSDEVLKGDYAGWLKDNGMDPADAPDFASFYQRSKTLGKDEFIVYEDGRPIVYKAHNPDLVRSLGALEPKERNVVWKILSAPSSVMRSGIVLSPDFIIKATVRDNFSSVLMNSFNVVPLVDPILGVGEVIGRSPTWVKWVKSGGANSAMLDFDRLNIAHRKILEGDPSASKKIWNAATTPYQYLAYGSTMMENSMRVGQFKRSLDKGIDPKVAALRARDVSLDFHRMGARVRSWNQISAFLGANINGIDRTIESFAKRPVSTTAKALGMLTLPSLALYAANREEEWYQDIPAYEKAVAWHWPIGEHRLPNGELNPDFHVARIAMPQVYGTAFGYAPVALLDAYMNDNPEDVGEILHQIFRSVNVFETAMPVVLSPMLDIGTNTNFHTGRPLVSRSLESQLPEYRYNEYTTETAKALANLLGEAAIIPDRFRTPKAIEHMVYSWSGNLGKAALDILDETLQEVGVVPENYRPTRDIEDIPFVGAFFLRYPNATKAVNDFYDATGEMDQIQATIDALNDQGKFEEAEEMMFDNFDMLMPTQEFKTALNTQYNAVRGVHYDETMTPDEKRQEIDTLMFELNESAKFYLEMIEDLQEAE